MSATPEEPRTQAGACCGQARTNGPAAAIVLSAGIGSATLGIAVVLSTASESVKNLLNWWNPTGPLAGKTSVGVIAWIVSWAILHSVWRRREVAFRRLWIVAAALVALGFAGTFPPIFEAFAPH
ncbi:MAG: hypothetical protein HY720_03565 [Planctomycetes bacterium]|nr:hypothetical protein [Planctomycetota bacterium]